MKVKLASIYFAELRAGRSAYNGNYRMPAVPKGDPPAIIELTDMVQRWQGSYAMGNGTDKRGIVSNLVLGEHIAHDLIMEWARSGLGMNEQIHPGVWMVREHVPTFGHDGNMIVDAMGAVVWATATEREKARMWEEDLAANTEADRLYAKYLIEYGDGVVMKDERLARFIPINCKRAATHYGVAREWNRELVSGNMGPCPFCGTIVSLDTIKCRECKEIVNTVKYARLIAEREAAVKAAKREFDQVPRQPVTTGLGIKPMPVKAPISVANEVEDEELEPA
jgi:hypothetical protein